MTVAKPVVDELNDRIAQIKAELGRSGYSIMRAHMAQFESSVVHRIFLEELAQLVARLAQTWQEISTAPKDRHLMLWCADEEGEHYSYRVGSWWDDDGERPYWQYDGESVAYSYAHQPTHWMPLPPPPTVG